MTFTRLRHILVGVSALLAAVPGARAYAQPPYYYGTYNPSDSTNSTPAANDQPPAVYRAVPLYRAVPVVRAPAWASPGAAALGPWPWNFDFGGGPTIVTGSNGELSGGSNFQFGGGYNFTPRTGLVLEFQNTWLGISDEQL